MRRREQMVRSNSPYRKQRGVLTYVLFLLMSLFAGLSALAVDVGRLYTLQVELQNAADACALAAAQQLATGNQASANVGTNVARDVVMSNRTDFQRRLLSSGNMTLKFSTSATAPESQWLLASSISATATNYRFARCAIQRIDLPTWFIYTRQNKPFATVRAQATAWRPPSTSTSNNCGMAPGKCAQAASLVQ